MAMTYDMLIGAKGTAGSIATWINSSTIQNDMPQIVAEAESWIYRRLRHWKMLTDPQSGTMTIGNDYITSPSDLLEPFLLWTTGIYFQFLEMRTTQDVIASWSYDGSGARVPQQPMLYYQGQGTLRFDSPPDRAYTYNLIYFQQPAPLSVSNETNFLTATYPRLMRVACMAAASEWMKDSGQGNYDRTYWDQLAMDDIDKAQAESDRAKRATVGGMMLVGGGGAPNLSPGYYGGY